ncbi:MAG: SDR family NAD(P)-dependent oxidoreductase [Nevskiales bacterium]
MSESRNILITGGQGFVGRALVNRFADEGHKVTCADINDAAFRDDVSFIKLDIRDAQAVDKALAGMDSIIHNASLVHTKHNRVEDVWAVNLTGTENIMAACEKHHIPRLVYISSASAVYEGNDIENGDETLPYSRISQAPYADSKIAAEKAVLAFSGKGPTVCCAIRPHVVFGAGDNRFIPAILTKIEQGKMDRAVGNRDKLSDFTYIDNLVDAVIAAEEKLQPGSVVSGQAYFVTNGEPMAFFDFIEKVVIELGHPPITKKVPYWLAYSVAAIAETIDTLKGGTLNAEDGLTRFAVRYMVTHHYFNIEKAKRDLDWTPKVSLDEGVKLTVQQLVTPYQHAPGEYQPGAVQQNELHPQVDEAGRIHTGKAREELSAVVVPGKHRVGNASRHTQQGTAVILKGRAKQQSQAGKTNQTVTHRQHFNHHEVGFGMQIANIATVDIGPPGIGPQCIAGFGNLFMQQQPGQLPAQMRAVGNDHKGQADHMQTLQASPATQAGQLKRRRHNTQPVGHRDLNRKHIGHGFTIKTPDKYQQAVERKGSDQTAKAEQPQQAKITMTLPQLQAYQAIQVIGHCSHSGHPFASSHAINSGTTVP